MSHLLNWPQNLLNITSNTTVVIPANMTILQIVVENTTGNAIVGGLKIGTTDGGIEVAAALTVSASAIIAISSSALSKCVFSTSSATTLYIQAVTLWNSAAINIHFLLRAFK